jgi:hypothetical protein
MNDEAQTNKLAMGFLQVKESNSADCKPYFIHPIDPFIKNYNFVDVPHLLKCVRNQLFSHSQISPGNET